MIGVLMDSETLAGQTNKWPECYPQKENVRNIFVGDPRVLNLVHYNTDHPETLCGQLMEATEVAGPNLDGFQLNAWPLIPDLEDYWELHPNKFLSLRIGSKALAQVESMKRFREFIGAYLPMIDTVLIDPNDNDNEGKTLRPAKGAEYLRVVRDYPTLGLGIAGILNPNMLHLLEPLIQEFPDLSIDARVNAE
jgi:hypothetical protein